MPEANWFQFASSNEGTGLAGEFTGALVVPFVDLLRPELQDFDLVPQP